MRFARFVKRTLGLRGLVLAVITVPVLLGSILAIADGDVQVGLFLLILGLLAPLTRALEATRHLGLAAAIWLAGGASFVAIGIAQPPEGSTSLSVISLVLGVGICVLIGLALGLQYFIDRRTTG